VNLVGTENVVRCAAETSVGRFVFFSSGGAIYGDTAVRADETTLPAPLSPYGVHKLAAEGYIRLSGLSHAILRPANVYGPRQRAGTDGGVIATFVDRLSRGEALQINGDGKQVRDFVYVADVAAAVRSALSWNCSGIWNVASGAETTVNDLAWHVGQALGVVPTVEYGPARGGDVRISRLSNERIIRQGSWRPDYTLAQGLAAMIAARTAHVFA
ncbi:MAG: NAD-dependent epimerase/dehydratase family protein, partial [Thermomicrobia bacterium]|nr:NAD-dependent epimerase/dehydratase family protein [Thermomicrobia bacterium]